MLAGASGTELAIGEWLPALRRAPVVLLGEVHDNLQHHRLRGELIRLWAPLDALLDVAGFDRRNWGWPAHQPLFEAAREAEADWIAAGVPRPRPAAGGGSRASTEALAPIIAAADWPPTAEAELETALVDGHCGMLPASALPAVAAFQRTRDASLAEPALAGPGRRNLILAGNGHVGRGHGVPRYLGAGTGQAISVGFLERKADGSAPSPEAMADFDWVVVTDGVADRPDPCSRFSPPGPKQTPAR